MGEEAYAVMKGLVNKKRDEYDVYGENVAVSLRKLRLLTPSLKLIKFYLMLSWGHYDQPSRMLTSFSISSGYDSYSPGYSGYIENQMQPGNIHHTENQMQPGNIPHIENIEMQPSTMQSVPGRTEETPNISSDGQEQYGAPALLSNDDSNFPFKNLLNLK